MAVWSSVNLSTLTSDIRLDAEYYRPDLIKLERNLEHSGARRFGEIPGQFITGPFGSDFNVENYIDNSSFRYVRGKDVKPFFLHDDDNAYLPEAYFDELSKYALKPLDLLISVVGTLGNCAIVPETIGSAVFSCKSTVWRSHEANDDLVLYLTAYLNSKFGQLLIQRLPRGHIQTGLNLEDLRSIPVFEPNSAAIKLIASMVRDSYSHLTNANQMIASAEGFLLEALGLDRLGLDRKQCYSRRFSDLTEESRFDAEFFSPRFQSIIRHLREDGRKIGDVAGLSEVYFDSTEKAKQSTFRYIEIGSLTGSGGVDYDIVPTADAPSRATWIVKSGDIITSTVRPIRRLSAMILDGQDGCVCSSGFAVLTPNVGEHGIEPEVLLTYLRLPIICEILNLYATASMYPAIAVQRLLQIPIKLPDTSIRKQIVAKVQQGMSLRLESARLLSQAENAIEDLISTTASGRGR